ncbi:hypothetical protein [Allonocardiopsis opalescens]|uniref:MFS transporter n=1 Tax=Allonocardiopsis opalescens TaxID=1144618 RepID=A0A2T0QE97_9ACTN|nr:hypothetical protein [Allonocardiopsis opalescens]PRY02173.1 hypothetical protein CLV72_101774 [Allonocardiopsis opalescens]
MSTRATRHVYLAVIVLHLVADVALSPFYPQLFERLFGITDLNATGVFIWVCRLTAVAALPLWGLAARRVPVGWLVVAGLAASAVLSFALGFAPTFTAFTVLSAALVFTTMALVLAYPAFMSLGAEHDRIRDVRSYAYVINIGTVAATLIGAGVMALPEVRWGISAFALVDIVLAAACYRVLLRSRRGAGAAGRPDGAAGTAAATGEAPVGARAGSAGGAGSAGTLVRAVALLAVLVLVSEVGRQVVRPFFTAYAEAGGAGPLAAAVLYLLPQLVAVAVLPSVVRVHRLLGGWLLPLSCAACAAGLLMQLPAAEPGPLLVAGRILFGAGLGFGHIALDLRVFEAVGTRGPAFAAVGTGRTVGTLVSPVLATPLAGADLAAPLAAGAGLFAALTLLAPLALLRPSARPPAAPAAGPPVKESDDVRVG